VSEQLATESEVTLTAEQAVAPETEPANPAAAPPSNAAVLCCCLAAEQARVSALANNENSSKAQYLADKAYAKAMSPLRGAGNIRDFIACVADGMLADCYSESSGAKLLHAAQVAYNAHTQHPLRRRKPTA